MEAQLDLTLRQIDLDESQAERENRKGVRHYAKRMWSTITKYVTYDNDAIFKDPNWPHLWS